MSFDEANDRANIGEGGGSQKSDTTFNVYWNLYWPYIVLHGKYLSKDKPYTLVHVATLFMFTLKIISIFINLFL